MSLRATQHVWSLRDEGKIPGGARLVVLLAVADSARSNTNMARASQRQLAELCGVHTMTVARALDDGYRAGALAVVYRSRGSGPSVFLCPPGPVDNSAEPEPNCATESRSDARSLRDSRAQYRATDARNPRNGNYQEAKSSPPAVPRGPAANRSPATERTPYGPKVAPADWDANAAAWLATLPPDADDYDARESATLSWPHDPDMRAHALDVWASEHAR
jgi:hypothetical protein